MERGVDRAREREVERATERGRCWDGQREGWSDMEKYEGEGERKRERTKLVLQYWSGGVCV